MIVPVILSGGSGSRLWPLSREQEPKQLLSLFGESTMLQDTVARLAGVSGTSKPMVVCNEAHRFLVAEQLRDVGRVDATVVLEPSARGTAPAVAAAACLAAESGGQESVLLVMPADHLVREADRFCAAVEVAVEAAQRGQLVTFGVVPIAAETGFGYIRAGEVRDGRDCGDGVRAVEQFIEKPNAVDAALFVASGDYLWNSGIFLFRADRYLEELGRFSPATINACRAACARATHENDFLRLDGESFAAAPADSVDYAVMEKTQDAVVVPLDAGWSDVGSWAALHDAASRDDNGNTRSGDVVALDCEDSYLYSSGRLVAGVGLRDTVVVETADAVLVAPRARAQDIKGLVEALKTRARGEATQHRRVQRPWGSYDSIDSGPGFQVKHLTVHPGAILSLQTHSQRAEHWVVVSGQARVTLDDEIFLLEENESIDIPVGAVHRVENPGDVPLHIIEVQSGSYLGEDDIVRLEDKYGREGTN